MDGLDFARPPDTVVQKEILKRKADGTNCTDKTNEKIREDPRYPRH